MVDVTRPDPAELVRAGEPKGYDQVVAFLVERLRAGALRVGDRLLPERELSARLNVSRPLVREALRSLAMIGLLEIQQGRGTFVRAPDISALADIFAFMFAQNDDEVDDMMEVRQALERQAVRLACARARPRDLEKMAAALGRIEATIDDPIAGGMADFQFHSSLVDAAHSPALGKMYAAVARILESSHIARRHRILSTSTSRDFLIDHHRRLFQAVASRDVEASERLLTSHFEIGEQLQSAVRTGGSQPQT